MTNKTLVSIPLIIAANEKNFVEKLNKISEDEIKLEDIISDEKTLSNLKNFASQNRHHDALIIFEEIFKFEPQNTMLHDNPDEKIAEMQEIAVNLDKSSTTPAEFITLKEQDITAIKKKIDRAFSNSLKSLKKDPWTQSTFQRASESFLPNEKTFQKTATGMKMMFDQNIASSDIRKFKKYLEVMPFLLHGEKYRYVLKIEPTVPSKDIEKIVSESEGFFGARGTPGFFHSDHNDGILASKHDGFLKTIQHTFLFDHSYNSPYDINGEYRNLHRSNLVEFVNKMFIESYPHEKTPVKFNRELASKILEKGGDFFSKLPLKIPEGIEQLYNKFVNRNLVQKPNHEKTFIDEIFYQKCIEVEFDKNLHIDYKFRRRINQMRFFSAFRGFMFEGGSSVIILLTMTTLITASSIASFYIFNPVLTLFFVSSAIPILILATILTTLSFAHHIPSCFNNKFDAINYCDYLNDNTYAGSKVTEETIKSNQESQLQNNEVTNDPQLQNNETPIDPKLQNNEVPNDQLINDSNKETPNPVTEPSNNTEILNITAENGNLNIEAAQEETMIGAEKQEIKADISPDSRIKEAEYENVNKPDLEIKK